MKTVKDILNKKGTQTYSVKTGTKVFDALQLMADKNIGAVLVINQEGVQGIFSERDYARKVILQGKSSHKLNVDSIMTSNVLYVTPEMKIDECMTLMIEKKIRHLPVLDNDKLTGLISIGDVVKELLDHKENMIGQLENYITHGR